MSENEKLTGGFTLNLDMDWLKRDKISVLS